MAAPAEKINLPSSKLNNQAVAIWVERQRAGSVLLSAVVAPHLIFPSDLPAVALDDAFRRLPRPEGSTLEARTAPSISGWGTCRSIDRVLSCDPEARIAHRLKTIQTGPHPHAPGWRYVLLPQRPINAKRQALNLIGEVRRRTVFCIGLCSSQVKDIRLHGQTGQFDDASLPKSLAKIKKSPSPIMSSPSRSYRASYPLSP